jgi:hypothetical protein
MRKAQPMFNRSAAISRRMKTKSELTILALVCALGAAPVVALAQHAAKDSALEAYASASPPSNPADEPSPPADNELTPEESAILENSLNFDPAKLNNDAPAKPLRLPRLSYPDSLDIKRTELPDGTSTVAVKQPLPVDWDAKVGADVGLAANAPDGYHSGVSRAANSTGAAWASVGLLPKFATVDARVDPSNDQGKLGTTIQHSMPLGSNFSVTLKNSYSVTETVSAAMPGPALPSALPTAQIWGNEKAAKLDILSTGTTLGAGLASSSIDPVTHQTLSAEQKLYGPLRVTTAVTDPGQPVSSKSITAGFKLNW